MTDAANLRATYDWAPPKDINGAGSMLSRLLVSDSFAWNKRHVNTALAILQAHPSLVTRHFSFQARSLTPILRRGTKEHLRGEAILKFPPLYHFLFNFGGGEGEGKGDMEFWVQAIKTVNALRKGEAHVPSTLPRNILPLQIACASKHVPVEIINLLITAEPWSVHEPAADGIFPFEVFLERCLKNYKDGVHQPSWDEHLLPCCDQLWSEPILQFSDNEGKEGYGIFHRLLGRAIQVECQPAIQTILKRTPPSFGERPFELSVNDAFSPELMQGLELVLPRLKNQMLTLTFANQALEEHLQATIATLPTLIRNQHGLKGLRFSMQDLHLVHVGFDKAFVAAIAAAMEQQPVNSSFERLDLHGPFCIGWESLLALLRNNGHTKILHILGCRIFLPSDSAVAQLTSSCHTSSLSYLDLNQVEFRMEGSRKLFELQCFKLVFQTLATISTWERFNLSVSFRDIAEVRNSDTTKLEITRAVLVLLDAAGRLSKVHLMIPFCWKTFCKHLETNESLRQLSVLGIGRDDICDLAKVLKDRNRTLRSFVSGVHYRHGPEDQLVQYYLFMNRWRHRIHGNPDIDCGGFLELLALAVAELADKEDRQIAGGEMSAVYGLLRENLSLCITAESVPCAAMAHQG